MNNLQLLQIAKDAMQYAYAPYSNNKVGACVLTADGKTYTGVSVENIAHGASSICAERAAIFNAVSNGDLNILKIAIFSKALTLPCGICRQVFVEFLPLGEIILGNTAGETKVYTLKELMPLMFSFKEV